MISKHVVIALTFLKFENNEYAARFYGSITCDYIHDLLKREPPEPVLTATRDGINWKHPFAKALKAAIEAKLEPLVEEEKRRALAEERGAINKKLRERLNSALKELNVIANLELGKVHRGLDGEGGDGEKMPYVPPSGFGFVPEYVYVQIGKPATLTLRAIVPGIVESGSLVTIESDNSEINIFTSQVIVEERVDFPGIGEAHIR